MINKFHSFQTQCRQSREFVMFPCPKNRVLIPQTIIPAPRHTSFNMASSPRAFIRAITRSSRAHPNHTGHGSPSTQQSSRPSTIYGVHETSRPSHSFISHRCIFTSSRLYQAQSATVPRPNSASSPPSATAAKPTTPPQPGSANLKAGLSDQPKKLLDESSSQIDWTTSFHGLSDAPFSKEAAAVLLNPLDPDDVEIKPDGIIYLPEIKYRRILNLAFGPGGWGLAPRGESTVTAKAVTREYALLVHGRYVISQLPFAVRL